MLQLIKQKNMKAMAKLFTLVCILTLTMSLTKEEDGDRLNGVWEPSNVKVRVKIEKIGTKYYGKIVWLKEPLDPTTQKPKVDKNNPDASMQNVPLKGYRLLKDFI